MEKVFVFGFLYEHFYGGEPIRINASNPLLWRFIMEKFALQNAASASLKRSMRDLFPDLIDITMEENGRGSLKSVPTNFGYAFFWYGWLNKKTLANIIQRMFPKRNLRKSRGAKSRILR
jgi:hypothetical protein